MMLSEQDIQAIQAIKSQVDLVGLIRSYGIRLEKHGKQYTGLCPFHHDTNPSLSVDPQKGLWNCLGACRGHGEKSGGDAIAFVMRKEQLSFAAALAKLKGSTTDPGDPPSVTPSASAPNRAELLERVVNYYHQTLLENPAALGYLETRGLRDGELIAAFKLGYADGTLLEKTPRDGPVYAPLKQIGLVTSSGRELFSGCVVFPVYQGDGVIAHLYGRHIKKRQHLYLPGRLAGVFNGSAAKVSAELIVTESIIDALSLWQAGFRNVIALYGINGFTEDHEALLRTCQTKKVYLCLDADEAGQAAAPTLGEKLTAMGIEGFNVVLPQKDPNEFFLQTPEAAAVFRRLMAEAPPLRPAAPSPTVASESPWRLRTEKDGYYFTFPSGREWRIRGLTAQGLDRLRVNVKVSAGGFFHLDTLDLYTARHRQSFFATAAHLLAADAAELGRELHALIEPLESLRLALRSEKGRGDGPVILSEEDRQAALTVLQAPDLIEQIQADFERVGFVGEPTALLVGYLATLSRKLDDPLAVVIVSRSGAGKSSLQDAICDFVPPEDLVKYTRVTGQALFYKAEDALQHKVLAIDEERGAEEAAYSIRNLQSAQVLSIAATRTDPQTGKLRTDSYKVYGPTVIMLTTTSPEALDYETRNRFVQLACDESREQTRRILASQRERDTLEGIVQREAAAQIRRRQHNLQRLLRPLKVVNPFSRYLTYPDERLQMRREQKKYLTLMKAIALLHQQQRPVKQWREGSTVIEYIEVTLEDIARANELASQVLGQSLEDLAPPSRTLLLEIKRMVEERSRQEKIQAADCVFTRRQIREYTGWSEWQVKVYAKQLEELEYLYPVNGARGQRYAYELLWNGEGLDGRPFLMGLMSVEQLKQKLPAAGDCPKNGQPGGGK